MYSFCRRAVDALLYFFYGTESWYYIVHVFQSLFKEIRAKVLGSFDPVNV